MRGIFSEERPKDVLWRELLQKTKALGRQVTPQDMRADPKMHDPNAYAYYWTSFDLAAEQAYRDWRMKQDGVTGARMIQPVERTARLRVAVAQKAPQTEEQARSVLAPIQEPTTRHKKGGRKALYDREAILDLLRQMKNALGRMPKTADWEQFPDYPTVTTFMRYLGPMKDWAKILDESESENR